MSTVSKSKTSKAQKPDPFRFGTRYVNTHAPDGTAIVKELPLTLENVLFPEMRDFIVHTDGHNNDVTYLKAVLKARLANRPTAGVLSDCRVDFNLPGIKPLAPDIIIFEGLKHYEDWATFNVSKEGATPLLVIEVTSPDTRKNDVGPKLDFYHQAQIPMYVIADVSGRKKQRHVNLIAYEYTPQAYQRVAADANGRIKLKTLGLSIGLTRDPRGGYERVACFDLVTDQEIGDYTALNAARIEADAQARLAQQEASAAKRRARASAKRADAQQARADAQQARADAQQTRADAQQARADAEAATRIELEARIRELEAKLTPRRGSGKPSS